MSFDYRHTYSIKLIALFLSVALLLSGCSLFNTDQTISVAPAENNQDKKNAIIINDKDQTSSSNTQEKTTKESDSDSHEKSSAIEKASSLPTTGEQAIVLNKRYDAFYIKMSPEEFESLGFALGDSVDIYLSNGISYRNVPYYSNDYVRLYEYYVYANIYDDTIDICCNYAPDFYVNDGVTADCTAVITLNKKEAYKSIEDLMNMEYSNNVEDFPNEEVFANFRELSGGKIAPGKFYRGASPCNNNTNRSPYVNDLMRSHGIKYVLDLADDRKTFENYRDQYGEEYTYDWDLFLNSQISFLEMDFDFTNVEYSAWIVDGLKDMLEHDGPYFIHCNEGMDRTGFVCALLEGLAGASYEEMRDDYMITYYNYYGINDQTNPEAYDRIVETYFDTFMMLLHDDRDHHALKKNNYKKDIEKYLTKGGMSKKQIKKLKKLLTSKEL